MTSFFEGRNILVTGANGFGGSHLTKLLVDNGANVTAFVRSKKQLVNLEGYVDRVNLVEGDVRNEKSVHEAVKDKDIVYHIATYLGSGVKSVMATSRDPMTTFETNVLGSVNVARKAVEENVRRMVFISTCHVYGEQPENLLPLKEDVPPNPVDLFAKSKYAAELCLRHFADDIELIITRAFNQFGEGHIGDFFVPKVVTHVLRGKKPVLWSPRPTRDFSYVKDVVGGYALLGDKGRKDEIYHFCSGKETSVGEMLNVIAKALGKDKLDVVWKSERPDDFSRSYGDYSKAKKELGWKPKTPMEEGMKRTIEWWKKHPELWELK